MSVSLDPLRSRALIVGLESYENPSFLPLPGVARDAVLFAEWLASQGVDPSSIALFATWDNPAEPSTMSELTTLVERGLRYNASGAQATIEQELISIADSEGDLVLLYWGGHGLMSEETRIVFASDTLSDAHRYLRVTNVQQYLRGTSYGSSILLVDACANFSSEADLRGPFDRGGLTAKPSKTRNQWTLFSAAKGKYGRRSGRPESTFSGVLLSLLKRGDLGQLLEPSALREAVDTEMRTLTSRGIARGATAIQTWQTPRSEEETIIYGENISTSPREAALAATQFATVIRAMSAHLDDFAGRELAERFSAIGGAAAARTLSELLSGRASEPVVSEETPEALVRAITARPGAAEEMLAELLRMALQESSLDTRALVSFALRLVHAVASTKQNVPPRGEGAGCMAFPGSISDPSFVTVIDLRRAPRFYGDESALLLLDVEEKTSDFRFATPTLLDKKDYYGSYSYVPRLWVAKPAPTATREEVVERLNSILLNLQTIKDPVSLPSQISSTDIASLWQVSLITGDRLVIEYPDPQKRKAMIDARSLAEEVMASLLTTEVGKRAEAERPLFDIRDMHGLASVLVGVNRVGANEKATRGVITASYGELAQLIRDAM